MRSKKSLEPGLRKHFDEKVRPNVVGKLPTRGQDGQHQEAIDRLQERSGSARHGHERRQAAADDHPRTRRISQAGGQGLVCDAGFSAAASQGASADRLGFARWLVAAGASLDGARAGQSHVAALLRHRHRQDFRGPRRARRISRASSAARLARGRISRTRLEHEGDASAHRHQCGLSPVEQDDPGASRRAIRRIGSSPGPADFACPR